MHRESELVVLRSEKPQDVVVFPVSGLEVLIDRADLARVSAVPWRRLVARRTTGADYIYIARKRLGKLILLHRFIMDAPAGLHVDHLNGNRLDNRRSNLRLCTHTENMQNRKTPINNTSGFKGVSWSESNNGWIARCQKKHLGTFQSKELAFEAYEAAARRAYSHLA